MFVLTLQATNIVSSVDAILDVLYYEQGDKITAWYHYKGDSAVNSAIAWLEALKRTTDILVFGQWSAPSLSSSDLLWVPEAEFLNKRICTEASINLHSVSNNLIYYWSLAIDALDIGDEDSFLYNINLWGYIDQFLEEAPVVTSCVEELYDLFDVLETLAEESVHELNRMRHHLLVGIPQPDELSKEFVEMDAELAYYKELQANYSALKSTKLDMAVSFTTETYAQSLKVLSRFTQATSNIILPIKDVITSMKSDISSRYQTSLQEMSALSGYYRKGLVEAWCRDLNIFRQPYVDTNSKSLLVYKVDQGGNLAAWPANVDLVSFTRNMSVEALAVLTSDYLQGILDLVQEIEAGLRSAEAGAMSALENMNVAMQQFYKSSQFDEEFVA